MEESAAHLLVGVFVVACGVIESMQEFLTANALWAAVNE